jgi:hypothetical protein
MEGLVEFMVSQQRTQNNQELALDAAEFWLCASEDEKMRGHLGPYLAKIVPVLLSSMVYSEDEILRLEGEEEDYEVEDREQDIKPTFASSKAGRLTNANGETTTTANGTLMRAKLTTSTMTTSLVILKSNGTSESALLRHSTSSHPFSMKQFLKQPCPT